MKMKGLQVWQLFEQKLVSRPLLSGVLSSLVFQCHIKCLTHEAADGNSGLSDDSCLSSVM